MCDAPINNDIKLDDSVDKQDGKVFVVGNEIRVCIVPAGLAAAGEVVATSRTHNRVR